MCGRFNIIDDPLTKLVSEVLGIKFSTQSNSNVCPSERIATIALSDNQNNCETNNSIAQVSATWGIKPDWAKKLLINAQAETVATKKTFRDAFSNARCVIPMSGWYEWKSDDTGKKQKFLFAQGNKPLYMAGILFEKPVEDTHPGLLEGLANVQTPEARDYHLVTLTTNANQQCSAIHHRMPLFIPAESVKPWILGKADNSKYLLLNQDEIFQISITN